ncbi:PREDICTED: uncharacterized vacuolar membrane protein YML018C-like [Lupinus angustifolius]|uniref:uncharacterized vacuolar membrane protein YML018C-like n=1 Tax=Lupinus angustifolius TaxID=3871 RepID=UPI00092E2B2F|nr:PREDICTED: uncharacterized vacuolar membrane protein YML018C-like [Lupinus angustifolius]
MGGCWRYHAGLGLIGAFVLIFVSSAEITQGIFREYKQPFVLTYLGVSLMVVHLPISVFKGWICSLLKTLCRNHHRRDYTPVRQETNLKCCLITDKDVKEREEGINKEEEDQPPLLEQIYEDTSWKIAKCGFYLTPIWFASEYFSNLALANTSVVSTTVLSSTSGLFTLFFGALFGQDSVNVTKLVAVLISMAGVAMTTIGKTWAADDKTRMSEAGKHSITGDIFGLLSAICYGLYTVLLKNSVGTGDKVDIQKFFGCIGLYCLIGFWWLAWPLNAARIEPPFELPSSKSTWKIVIANSIWSSVISDYFWALSIVWTSPLVATLGMSLTIPVAMIADMVIHARNYSATYILGCIQVFAGFSLANLSDKFSRNDAELTSSCYEKQELCILNEEETMYVNW